MRRICVYLLLAMTICSCGGRKVPDLSGIKVDLQMQRFENDFFSVDTNRVDQSLQQLHNKYPSFLQDFVFNILALPPQPDSSAVVEKEVRTFIRSYSPLKASAERPFSDMSNTQKE